MTIYLISVIVLTLYCLLGHVLVSFVRLVAQQHDLLVTRRAWQSHSETCPHLASGSKSRTIHQNKRAVSDIIRRHSKREAEMSQERPRLPTHGQRAPGQGTDAVGYGASGRQRPGDDRPGESRILTIGLQESILAGWRRAVLFRLVRCGQVTM